MSGARIDLLPQAALEIEEASAWYLERSVRAAEGFVLAIDLGLEAIASRPRLWAPFEAGTRRYVLPTYPYSIIFRERPGGGVEEWRWLRWLTRNASRGTGWIVKS